MSKRWVIALLSVVVLLAGACEPAEDDESADLGTDEEPELDETDAQQRLEDAVATTFDEGSAEFTSAMDAPTSEAETGSDAGAEDDGTSAGDDGMSAEDNGTSDDIDDDDGVSTDAGDDTADDDGAMTGESDDAGSTGDTGRTAQTEIDGAADWDEDLREMTLSPGGTIQGMGATAILEQSDLYVQLEGGAQSDADTAPEDEAADADADEDGEAGDTDEAADAGSADAQWAHISVHELLDAEPAASQLLLHDPTPVLGALQDATVDVREGAAAADVSDGVSAEEDAAEDDGVSAEDSAAEDEGMSTEDDGATDGDALTEEADLIATVDTTESDEPALEALAQQTGSDELDVKVWVESATAMNGDDDGGLTDGGDDDDERIAQLAINLPADAVHDDSAGTVEDSAAEEGDAPEDDGAADDESTGDAEDDGVADDDTATDASATDGSAVGHERELTIELTSFGTEVGIEAPEDDNVVEVEADELRAMFGDRGQGGEPTPTPTPESDDADVDEGTTDS